MEQEDFQGRDQRSKYHQTVERRPYDFISAGDTNSWDYALHRSASMKTSLDIRLRKRNSHSFINDVELPIQAMHQTSMEIGFAERLYLQRNIIENDGIICNHRFFRVPEK